MVKKKIVLATHNAGKCREFQAFFSTFPSLEIISQIELGVHPVDETGLTFIENALLKARHASLLTGLPAMADDSGLVIDALQGRPGIHSARYSSAGDAGNIQKVLAELSAVPERTARFYCVIVFLKNATDPMPYIGEGIWEGRILQEARGSKGFGYDPIFAATNESCSVAEFSLEEKNKQSHRAQALRQLSSLLKKEVDYV